MRDLVAVFGEIRESVPDVSIREQLDAYMRPILNSWGSASERSRVHMWEYFATVLDEVIRTDINTPLDSWECRVTDIFCGRVGNTVPLDYDNGG